MMIAMRVIVNFNTFNCFPIFIQSNLSVCGCTHFVSIMFLIPMSIFITNFRVKYSVNICWFIFHLTKRLNLYQRKFIFICKKGSISLSPFRYANNDKVFTHIYNEWIRFCICLWLKWFCINSILLR